MLRSLVGSEMCIRDSISFLWLEDVLDAYFNPARRLLWRCGPVLVLRLTIPADGQVSRVHAPLLIDMAKWLYLPRGELKPEIIQAEYDKLKGREKANNLSLFQKLKKRLEKTLGRGIPNGSLEHRYLRALTGAYQYKLVGVLRRSNHSISDPAGRWWCLLRHRVSKHEVHWWKFDDLTREQVFTEDVAYFADMGNSVVVRSSDFLFYERYLPAV
eukprot:TRINITY_DN37201_c0_g1_i1.p1 TRINITY_DN37201_c0_g1~~TRINITY_DN37201_c0_g1_i1.p1  ORF type:complete len:249 (+),score=63.20 TRINITY_DN37201_c0_g1_i1:107-748(+)